MLLQNSRSPSGSRVERVLQIAKVHLRDWDGAGAHGTGCSFPMRFCYAFKTSDWRSRGNGLCIVHKNSRSPSGHLSSWYHHETDHLVNGHLI